MVKFICQRNIRFNSKFTTKNKIEKFELNNITATKDTNIYYIISKLKKECLSNNFEYKINSIYRKNQISKNIPFRTKKKENLLLLNLILYLIILINPILSRFIILIQIKDTFTQDKEKIINIKHIKKPDEIELNGSRMENTYYECDDDYLYIKRDNSNYKSNNNIVKLIWNKIKPDDTSENRRILKGNNLNSKNMISFNSSLSNYLNDQNLTAKNQANKNNSLSSLFNKKRNLPLSNLVEMGSIPINTQNLIPFNPEEIDTTEATEEIIISELNGESMFKSCTFIDSVDFSYFDMSIITNMAHMFEDSSVISISGFNPINTEDVSYLFSNCISLSSIDYKNIINSSPVNDKIKKMEYMYYNCQNIKEINFSIYNTNNVVDMSYMFAECTTLTSLTGTNNFRTPEVKNMNYMFHNCKDLKTLPLIEKFESTSLLYMSYMFSGCDNLESLLFTNFIVSQLIDMSYSFSKCSSLKTVELSSLDFSKVENMKYLFFLIAKA